MSPSYLELYRNAKLDEVIDRVYRLLESCAICPRLCRVNRLKDKKGFCRTGLKPKVYAAFPHYGEEPPISGDRGSGTIFFSNCNLRCIYCQNYRFSQKGEGREIEIQELAELMLKLQEKGCHNINLVTPTHVMPQILSALKSAISGGLEIPIVYNTSGYELPEIIKNLEGIVDIYLADMRYADSAMAGKYSGADNYPRYNRASIKEMHRQVGIAKINKEGIIESGLIIRHLVLPHNISGTHQILRFIAEELSEETYVSLMSQYLPCHKAGADPQLNRRITEEEYSQAIKVRENCGLYNGWIQEARGSESLAGINIKSNIGS
ncbi:MAG: radical SAM protein [Candidatus Omnitrophica bacterium]|nr:radical SAM protein [Candidatus Omnitrophota bacterium]MCM8770420.1 radical SAM protein [Candidatus Omnitrophota bacterium]